MILLFCTKLWIAASRNYLLLGPLGAVVIDQSQCELTFIKYIFRNIFSERFDGEQGLVVVRV